MRICKLNSELLSILVEEIKQVQMPKGWPTDWLDELKSEMIDQIVDAEGIPSNLNSCGCNGGESLPKETSEKLSQLIKAEDFWHDGWDAVNLEAKVACHASAYVDTWNKIGEILFQYDTNHDREWYQEHWMQTPTPMEEIVEEYIHYELPKDAEVGKCWDLPDNFISFRDEPDAPSWDFGFPEFRAYISAIRATEYPDLLQVDYVVYRRNEAHCEGYYGVWDTDTAYVNTKTCRRWHKS